MSPSLVAFERLRQRMRERNDELRPRLADWLREVIPTRGRKVPYLVRGSAGPSADGWCCGISLLPPRKIARPWFSIAPTVPVEPTEAEVAMLGMDPQHLYQIPMAWLLEVLAEAWVEAGFADRAITLELSSSVFRGLDQRFQWTDRLRAEAYRVTAPMPPSITTRSLSQGNLVAPPGPSSLPDTPAALRDACRAGSPGAALAWADALAAAGDRRSADLLRWLDGFSASIAEPARIWAGRGPFWVYANADVYWWGTGESGTESGENEEPATRLAQLLAGWNVYHPAVEWLLRRLSLRFVHVRGSYFADGSQGQNVDLDLGAGDHLAPFEETMGVTEVRADSVRYADGEE